MKVFFKKNKRIVCSLILGLLPLLACLINLLINGKHFTDIWLGQSQWNDELFYFKQIECMVKDTIPNGFFGYNESCAKVLSFGAWSPVILMPWAVWGKIFGWNFLSPIIANIVFLTVAMFLLGFFSNPSYEQTLGLSLLFLVMAPLSRYMFSSMPEIVCLAPVLVVIGLVSGYKRSNHKKLRMTMMLLLLAFLTLMRPYFFVFFVFPFFVKDTKGGRNKIFSVVVAIVSLLAYFVISSKMNAPYFSDVYRTDWVRTFQSEGLLGGFVNLIKELVFYLGQILMASIGGARGGYPVGIYFAAFLFIIGEFLVLTIYLLIKRDRKFTEALGMFFCQFAMLGAICLMYSLQDGFRHLLVFVFSGLCLSVFMLDRQALRRGLLLINTLVVIWLFIVKAKDPLYFGSVFNNEKELSSKTSVVELQDELKNAMVSGDKLSWDNDVALVFMDAKEGEEDHLLRWQYAYAIPRGFAVSLCEATYVSENIDTLKSKYIMTLTDGKIERLLISKNAKFISGNDSVSVYEMP
ncbi:MAG: hypothetical protein MJ123_00780 [Lachnospiraceae bacterium]|nr:hypothetical protein [Lachnospiraceae bacterium]